MKDRACLERTGEWLASLGLQEYTPRFKENHIDFSFLPNLSEQDLKELGVTSLGHRRKMMRAIAELKHTEASEARMTSPTPQPLPAKARDCREILQSDDS
jgi:SAM domain (Sterile alpha motif)